MGNWIGENFYTWESHGCVYIGANIKDFSCKLRRGWSNRCSCERNKCDPRLGHTSNFEQRCFHALRRGAGGMLWQITLQHRSLLFPKEEFRCENRRLNIGVFSWVKRKQQTLANITFTRWTSASANSNPLPFSQGLIKAEGTTRLLTVREGNGSKRLAYLKHSFHLAAYNSWDWSPCPRVSLRSGGRKHPLLPSSSFVTEHSQLVCQSTLQLPSGPGKFCSSCLVLLTETQQPVWTAFLRKEQRRRAAEKEGNNLQTQDRSARCRRGDFLWGGDPWVF